MTISRRGFLTLAGGAAVTGTAGWAALVREHSSSRPAVSAPPTDADHVLVVVQLSGGNDAINTLIAPDGRYHDLRPSLAVTDDQLVALRGEPGVALHPALRDLTPLWESHRLAIVPGVGFAQASRSHFESLAAWWTGSPEHTQTTGWLGRWLDRTSTEANPLVAVSLGGGAAPAVRAEHTISTAVNDISSFQVRAPRGATSDAITEALLATASPASTEPLLAAAQQATRSALAAVDTMSAVQDKVSVIEGDDPDAAQAGPIASGLAAAASIIELGLGTRIVLVSASGFDTHANQVNAHPRLLADLSHGMASFFATLDKANLSDRVLLLTTSEFGRRAQENGSAGTDHGHGAVQFVAGPRVQGGLHGSMDLTHLTDGDLTSTVDTRSLYAAALDWLGGPTDEVLGATYDRLALIA
jgi:uncharacterized protein (DUF1501 family)